jgi:uncharacterized Ntn-hydrolase superfamily protein
MTFSIIAHCPESGRLGIGTATFSIACGRRNESVRPNVGISKSQAFYVRAVDPRVLNMLTLGYTPEHILRVLEANDPDFDYRQIGIIDREGHAVAHTGAKVGIWAGHQVGAGYAAFGNGLAGPEVLAGIVAGFLEADGEPLEYRLLRAIEGGRDCGGQAANGIRRPERSAWIRVVGRADPPEIDLRVDLHTKAIDALRVVLEEVSRGEGVTI